MSNEAKQENTRSVTVVATTITVVVLSFLTVLLRLISRLAVVRRVTLDDLFIVVAWLIALGMSIAIYIGVRYGLGKHDQDIRLEWRGTLNRSQYIFTVLYNPALMATKTSILVFYLSLTIATQKFFKFATLTTLVVVNVAGCVLTILNIVQCHPIDAVFQYPLPQEARCIDILNLSLASAPVNIITDLAILFLPLPIFTSLRISLKQKLALVSVFGYLQQASQIGLHWANLNDTPNDNMEDQDFFWYASQSFMWSIVEVNIGITSACIPTLKPAICWAVDHLPVRSKTCRQEFIGTSRQQYGIQERGRVTGGAEMVEYVLADRRNNVQSDYYTTQGGELPPFLQSGNHLDTAQAPEGVFFDFVGSPRLKSMITLNTKESIRPLVIINTLFFVIGFAEANLYDLTCKFKVLSHMTKLEILVTYSLYYCGFFVAPLTFGWIILQKYSFKATIITGLCIYSCGVLTFWPSAVLGSLPTFMLSNLIVGTGIATLELGMNPFVALCGQPQFPELRLNFSYFVRGLGGTVSQLVIREPIFGSPTDPRTLVIAQWEYLGLAFLCIASMLVLYYLPLPDASDEDLASQSLGWHSVDTPRIGRLNVLYLTLAFGLFTQLCYKPAEALIQIIEAHYLIGITKTTAQASLAAGRLVAATSMIFLKPRYVFTCFQVGSIVTAIVATQLDLNGVIVDTMLVLFFTSTIYPTTMGVSLRGLGSRVKLASVLIIAASSSAAIVLPFVDHLVDNNTCRRAWFLMVGLLVPMVVFPLYVNLTPAARKQVNPVKDEMAHQSSQLALA